MGDSEVGYSPVYAIHEGTVKKVAYDSGLGWFIWVISPDKYVEIYQEGFNNKSDIYVKAGQKIGKLTGSHLHLGLTKTTKKYINKNGFPYAITGTLTMELGSNQSVLLRSALTRNN